MIESAEVSDGVQHERRQKVNGSASNLSGGIECAGLTKVYGDGTKALDTLDLSVEAGHLVALVGPSGCGKTTLLRMIAGLEHITSGQLSIDGRVVNQLPPRQRDIAMIFQSYALYPHMTVRDNLAFGLKIRRTSRKEIDTRVREVAELLGLGSSLGKRPAQLSGGQRQRVAMGRAIVREPKIFLMDEPLSNLDAQLRVQMRTEIARLQRRLGVTTVYVTHDQTEAMVLGDRVAVLMGGLLQQYATPEEVYDRPANVFVARFIGSPSMNLIEATVTRADANTVVTFGESVLSFASAALPHLPVESGAGSTQLLWGIRPESLEELGASTAPDRPRLRGIVELREQHGSDVFVHVSLAGSLRTLGGFVDDAGAEDAAALDARGLIVARLSPRSKVKEGEPVELSVDPAGVHFFDPVTERRI
jgi:multiple sugar transport system ATP-binding protein